MWFADEIPDTSYGIRRLASAGIRNELVLDRLTYPLSGILPTLYVNVNTVVFEEIECAAFSFDMELQEGAYLCGNSTLCQTAIWKKSSIGGCSTSHLKEFIRECLRDKVDEFINDYLAANPKDRPSQNEA